MDDKDTDSSLALDDVPVDRAVKRQRSNPAATQTWPNGRTPAQERLADLVSANAISGMTHHQILDDIFVLLELLTGYDPFFFFLIMCDLPLSSLVIEQGAITKEMTWLPR